MGFSFFLALRYIRPKRSIASVITCVSILGVLLGVAVIIVVRGVMTGFGDSWREKVLEFKPHITLMATRGRPILDEAPLVEDLRRTPGVVAVTPEIDTRAMASARGRVLAPVLVGIAGDGFADAYKVGPPIAGTFDLKPDTLIVGLEFARALGVWVGDEVTVCAPPLPDEVYLPRKWRVGGIFRSGHYDYDYDYIIADLDSARDLVGLEEGVRAIHLRTAAPADAAAFEATVKALPLNGRPLRVLTWQEADRQLFNALAVETNLTAVLLSLISIVALFCVMNTLLVLTVQKTPEIGLLKSLGFGKLQIMGVFLVHGIIQCTVGVVLGLLASWAVLSNLQRLVELLGKFGVQVFPADIYKLEEIPHRVDSADVVMVVAAIYVFGLLASLVPALIAAAKDPVKALNE